MPLRLEDFEAAASRYPKASRLILKETETGDFSIEPHTGSLAGSTVKFLLGKSESSKNKAIVEAFKQALKEAVGFDHSESSEYSFLKEYLQECEKEGLSSDAIGRVVQLQFPVAEEVKIPLATPLTQNEDMAEDILEDISPLESLSGFEEAQNFIRNTLQGREAPLSVVAPDPIKNGPKPAEVVTSDGKRHSFVQDVSIQAKPLADELNIKIFDGRSYIEADAPSSGIAETSEVPTAVKISRGDKNRTQRQEENNHIPKMLSSEEIRIIARNVMRDS